MMLCCWHPNADLLCEWSHEESLRSGTFLGICAALSASLQHHTLVVQAAFWVSSLHPVMERLQPASCLRGSPGRKNQHHSTHANFSQVLPTGALLQPTLSSRCQRRASAAQQVLSRKCGVSVPSCISIVPPMS